MQCKLKTLNDSVDVVQQNIVMRKLSPEMFTRK